MTATQEYLLSLPERVFRSASALAGGLLREISQVTLPAAVRRSNLYRALVDVTLRFMIEQAGQVEGVYPAEGELAHNFVLRRTAGHGIEIAGLLAFHASPVWVLAALADLTGAGRSLIHEISGSLKEEGLLDPGTQFENLDQILDGLEKTTGRLAMTMNAPPIDIAGLREEWAAIRERVHAIPPRRLPSAEQLRHSWSGIRAEAEAQGRSVFELSSLMALSAVARVPENIRWLSRAARSAGRRTGQIFAGALLDHYSQTLQEIRETGYLKYWAREFRPYLRAAADQFSPRRIALTQRLLRRKT